MLYFLHITVYLMLYLFKLRDFMHDMQDIVLAGWWFLPSCVRNIQNSQFFKSHVQVWWYYLLESVDVMLLRKILEFFFSRFFFRTVSGVGNTSLATSQVSKINDISGVCIDMYTYREMKSQFEVKNYTFTLPKNNFWN